MKPRIEAHARQRIKAPAEKVYGAWLDPAQVRVWMATSLQSCGLAGDIQRVEIDAHVGGKFFFSDLRDGKEARHWGTYLELERPRKIVFTWIVAESEEADPSVVTLTTQPEADGCVATIVHAMDPKWAEYVARTEAGWTRILKAIEGSLV
jgi:uncharacterized protein YndB with AHSA1/START domain